MGAFDILLIGGGMNQDRFLVEKTVNDLSKVLTDRVIGGVWVNRCGWWWMLVDGEWISCGLGGSRLVELNTELVIDGCEIGYKVKRIWPISSMFCFSQTGIGPVIDFFGWETVGTNGLLGVILSDLKLARMVTGGVPMGEEIEGAEDFYISFIGRNNFLPSRLLQMREKNMVIADKGLEREIQRSLIGLVKKYQINDLVVIKIRAKGDAWSVDQFMIFPEVDRDSLWARIWQTSGLGYDAIIRKTVEENY